LVECTACHLNYVNPRPTFEALGRHYPPDYFASRPPDAAPWLFRPIARAAVALQAMGRISATERVLGRLTPGTKILDIGCGLNEFLNQTMRVRRCEGIGVELNAKVVEYVRRASRAPILEGTLVDGGFDDEAFDLITMFQYLEHEPNPRQVLDEARRVVKKGGHIAIEIPHIMGLPARLFGPRWGALDLPRHLVFYTPQSLGAMLEKSGFKLLRYRPFGLPGAFGVSLAAFVGCRHLNRMNSAQMGLMTLASIPFMPFASLLPDFLFAVARAE
jgi:SAM-dependent methyltransferase